MSYSSEEIDALQKRLKAVEDAINELKKEDLHIAQMIGSLLCIMEYHMTSLFFKGEQIKPYAELWSKKLDATKEELDASETLESALDIVRKFHNELIKYTAARKVPTAEEAMDIAHAFIKKYTGFALPVKAVKEDDVWLVDVDVGALAVKIAKLKVDARTGDILSYEIPEK